MKAYFLFAAILVTPMNIHAQTQMGIVKTRGRMVNGVLKPGMGLDGATVQLNGRNVLTKNEVGKKGCFSFPVNGKNFLVKSVTKKGYQLVDPQVCREYKYSDNVLYLVMESPEQLLADKLSQERKQRQMLERRLQKREAEVARLHVSIEEKNRLLQEINKEREENETIISNLSKYYATLDYDQLDDFQRTVTNFLENGQLEEADSMLRTRGSMEVRIKDVMDEQQAEAKEEAVLAQRKSDLEVSRVGSRKMLETVAADCYNFYQRFMQAHQNDSAAHYLELRAALDTTNVKWQTEASLFIKDYLADYDKALNYFQCVLQQCLQQYGELSEWTATVYNNIGGIYDIQGDYTKALEYYEKALLLQKQVLGSEHPDIAMSYNNIGSVYFNMGDYHNALMFLEKSLSIREKLLGMEHTIRRLWTIMGRH